METKGLVLLPFKMVVSSQQPGGLCLLLLTEVGTHVLKVTAWLHSISLWTCVCMYVVVGYNASSDPIWEGSA